MDGVAIDTTDYTAYSSAGVAERVYTLTSGVDYLTADLFELQFAQKEDVLYMIGYLNAYQVPNVINIGTSQDAYDRNYQIVKFFMGDYSLGDKQYYWNRDFGTTELFDVYDSYLKNMGRYFGLDGLEMIPKLERKAAKLYDEVAGKSDNLKIWKKVEIIENFPILKSLFNALSDVCPSIEWSSIEYTIDKRHTMHFLNRCMEDFSIEQWKIDRNGSLAFLLFYCLLPIAHKILL
jgi:predicted metalloendopeptidase